MAKRVNMDSIRLKSSLVAHLMTGKATLKRGLSSPIFFSTALIIKADKDTSFNYFD